MQSFHRSTSSNQDRAFGERCYIIPMPGIHNEFDLSMSEAIEKFCLRPSDFKKLKFKRIVPSVDSDDHSQEPTANKSVRNSTPQKYFVTSDCYKVALNKYNGEEGLKSARINWKKGTAQLNSPLSPSKCSIKIIGSVLESLSTPSPNALSLSGRKEVSRHDSKKTKNINPRMEKKGKKRTSSERDSITAKKFQQKRKAESKSVFDISVEKKSRNSMRIDDSFDNPERKGILSQRKAQTSKSTVLKREPTVSETKGNPCTCKWTEVTATFHILVDETRDFIANSEKKVLSSGEKKMLKIILEHVKDNVRSMSHALLINKQLALKAKAANSHCTKLRNTSLETRTLIQSIQQECRYLQNEISKSKMTLEIDRNASQVLNIFRDLYKG